MTIFHVYFITDCTDDAARADVEAALLIAAENSGLDQPRFVFQGVDKFNPVALSHAAAHRFQTNSALRAHLYHDGHPRRSRDVIIVNAAPPKSAFGKDANGHNDRDNFVVGTLNDGTIIAGTLNGLSLLKPMIDELYEFVPSNNGSQFRSRDVLPQIALLYAAEHLSLDNLEKKRCLKNPALRGALIHFGKSPMTPLFDPSEVLKELPISAVPDLPGDVSRVVTIDNFPNIKIKFSDADRASLTEAFNANGQTPVQVVFEGGQPISATLAERLFDGDEGQIVVTLESSSLIFTDASRHNKEVMGQLVTLQRTPESNITYPLPIIGCPVSFKIG